MPIPCEVIAERFAKTLYPAGLSRIVSLLNLSKQKTRHRRLQFDAKTRAASQKIGLREALKAVAAAKGRTGHRRRAREQRPLGLCDTRFTSAYLCAVVCPTSGADFALIIPTVSGAPTPLFLDRISRSLEPDVHAMFVLDQAGSHGCPALACQTASRWYRSGPTVWS